MTMGFPTRLIAQYSVDEVIERMNTTQHLVLSDVRDSLDPRDVNEGAERRHRDRDHMPGRAQSIDRLMQRNIRGRK